MSSRREVLPGGFPSRFHIALAGWIACAACWVSSIAVSAPGDLQSLREVNSSVPHGNFGQSVAAVGANRFAAGAPYFNMSQRFSPTVTNAGVAYLYDLNTNLVATLWNPDPRKDDYFGWTMAGVGMNQVAVGAPYKDIATPPPVSLLLPNVGAVYLFDSNGVPVRAFNHPTPSLNDPDAFGMAIAPLGSDRILIGAPDDEVGTTNAAGKVFVFDLNGNLLQTLLAPHPTVYGRFGDAIAGLGTNRFAVGAPGENVPGVGTGRVYLYDGNGNLLKTLTHPAGQGAYFGWSVSPIGTNGWFAVGAPYDDVQTTVGGIATNYAQAGKVHLYDANGVYHQTISSAAPSTFGIFGSTLARVGSSRFVVGAPYEAPTGFSSGAAYLFNLDGLRLATLANPEPSQYDTFGGGIAGVGEEFIVVGASGDSAQAVSGGSVYVYQAPIVEFYLGQEIAPPGGVAVDQLPVTGPAVQPAGAAFWYNPAKKLYAAKAGSVLIGWPTAGNTTNYVQGINVWPTNAADYQWHVAGSPAVDLSGYASTELWQTDAGTGVDPDQVKFGKKFSATGPGRSLMLFSSGNPQADPIFFQLVKSIAWNDPAYLHDNAPAVIGSVITNTYGYHDTNCGGPFVVQSNSVYCAAPGFYNRALRTGPIVPVNTDKPDVYTDDLVVAYYQKGTRLKDVNGASVSSALCWAWKPVRYNPQWPTNPPVIVIASQKGTDVIDPAVYPNWDLYYQNDASAPGFNPNDEHALRRPYGSGEAIFALRDDLGTPQTSDPYVLMSYQDPAAPTGLGGRMKVWRVVAQGPDQFSYGGTAGSLLQPPFPLSTLPPCVESTGVSGRYWRDRKLAFWARAAGDDGAPSTIVMRYFYPVQSGFFFPNGYQPALGASVPWLDVRAGTPGTPMNIAYTIAWPAAPELHVGETLWKPKAGLPDISGQSSVEILYQQSVSQGKGASVQLIDPAREREVDLAALPAGLPTVQEQGLVYFPTLPPQLRSRFRYDPINAKLKFKGEIIEPPASEAYLLLNVLTSREKAVLLALSNDGPFQTAVNALAAAASDPADVLPDATARALTAGLGTGTGFVTLAFGNGTNAGPADPVSLQVIQVVCPLYQGAIEVIESANPFDEKLTLRHSGDFAGRPDQYIFEWRTLPPNNGLPQQPPDSWTVFTPVPGNGQGAVDVTLQGAGLQTLSDNYFICRYRPVDPANPCGGAWSAWTAPALAEGWIKRVLGGINPFEQKFKSYQDHSANTIVSMISQAGARWVGNVPLNQQAADSFGLIEIYETILKRGIGLSIEGAPPVNYPPANDALLLAAGRVADLYLLLGNEAFADAADPTIAFGTDGIYGSATPSIHCFMNQTDSLLEEELALLRGRDDSQLPGVQTYPAYNRLIWNFTHDLNGGEVAYALNYNIQDQNGDAAGTIDEADARALYPQGHGDAWGHYLTAIKNYYRLLRSPNFTWVPRAESVLVGGAPVSVDYLDERKFAHAAASRAQTGAEIVNLTYRRFYVEDPKGQYQGYRDGNTNRAWGLAEWGSRSAQGALFDWITANAILPALDTNAAHSGIQKIDRTTVKELNDLASSLADIQVQVDNADRGLNPLGLAKDVLPFDIDPALITQGKTHFEQIYDRAVKALNNAVEVFNHANNSTQLLRRQADSVQKFQDSVDDRESDFNNRLIEIFGYPYADDIGGAGAYPAGYSGPDIYHYDYVDASALLGVPSPAGQTLNVTMKEYAVNTNGALATTSKTVPFNVAPHGLGVIKPAAWIGQRQAPGELQMARSDLLQARGRFEKLLADYNKLLDDIEDQSQVLVAQFNANLNEIQILNDALSTQKELLGEINDERAKQKFFNTAANTSKRLADAAAEALPKSVGTSMDATSMARGALQVMGTISSELLSKEADRNAELEQSNVQARDLEQYLTNIKLTTLRDDTAFLHQLAQLEQLVRQEVGLRLEIYTLNEAMQQSSGRYLAALSRGIRLLDDRLRFRRQTAAEVQAYRYKDMAFRIFRNDALQKYRAQFDLAARYVYLAARAYDFETCLSAGDPRGPGEKFLTDIVRSRSLGVIESDHPHTGPAEGDPGLADPMARMWLNWDLVLKGQLGFNNPQTETGRFSLRSENFRVQPGFAGNIAWRQKLTQLVVSNLLDMPEFQRYCIPFQPMLAVEPGIVIPFSTTVTFGQNFFGWPAGGGDNDYDSTHFATKIRSVGVWFANYNNLGSGMINTPRVYLIPVGDDILRSPTGSAGKIRQWTVMDQLLPVPFPLSSDALSNPNWIPINDTLAGDLGDLRKFARFRAYHDGGTFDESQTINDSRLIGRSVWNTRWLLIIPAGSLHSDRSEGLERFINGQLVNGARDGNGVSDIKIFFQTYAYSGN